MKLWEPKRIKYANKSECLNLQIFIFKNTTVFVMKEREKKKKKKKRKRNKTNIDDSAKLEGPARIYEMDLLLACYKRQKISNLCIN